MMRRFSLFLIPAMLVVIPSVQAEKNDWLVRVRAIDIQPENKSDAIPALGVPTDAICNAQNARQFALPISQNGASSASRLRECGR
jgi:outer membrane protein W